ncbi:hypothetical protein BUALT_Bualt02G0070500 [Buddleja alternifolia]|uniref:Protein kinase domain-containing protein n=1 Tax=Buddleja alternifolia TaxID=168488 RepID=A0AAV6Y8Z7_9LAMI|nr:hypothetical protein BUALT_Bualt02G0070500 [Buddleja alternifolia]
MEKVKKNRSNWVRGSCIGRGAYGTVNLGINISNGAVFAVKSVDLLSALPSQVQALENEITILKTLSSPYIVKYLGDDTTSSLRNLHMEYLPAGTAADVATHSNESAIRSYTRCLVSALSYLHSRGIMHCDVKGKNVLLGPSPGSAKLADFGSAAEISSIAARGSPLWMAPEVVREEYQGPESDVWSLGCTVIEMVTGKPAVDAVSILSGELPRLPARLSGSGRDFLDKCFRRDYTQRWSCDQLLRHPFISMCSQENLIDYRYSSPRCVLDLGFHCSSEEDDEDDEILNLGAKGRIRGLVTGAGANWESDDHWVDVRGLPRAHFPVAADSLITKVGNCSENILDSNYCNMNVVLPVEQNGVVASQCREPQHLKYDEGIL